MLSRFPLIVVVPVAAEVPYLAPGLRWTKGVLELARRVRESSQVC